LEAVPVAIFFGIAWATTGPGIVRRIIKWKR
jgi:hypothetical protein